MLLPDKGSFALELYEQLGPMTDWDEELDFPIQRFWGSAVNQAFQPLEDLARDQGDRPGYAVALDPDAALVEDLPWLAQFTGTEVPPGLREEDVRLLAKTAPNLHRGTVDHLREKVRATLDPSTPRRVLVIERDGNASTISVYTYLIETPDLVLTEKVARRFKRAKLILNYVAISGGTYGSLAVEVADYTTVEADFTDYRDLLLNSP